MNDLYSTRTLTAEQAAFVLPRLAEAGFKPNEAGEIVAENMKDEDLAHRIIAEAVTRDKYERPRRSVVAVVEGFAKQSTPTPLDALRDYGITAAEGEPFTIKTDHGLSRLRERFTAATMDLPEGHGWRLFALLDPEAVEGKAQWRVTVGRADAWPFPSADLLSGVLDKALDTARLATKASPFYGVARATMKAGTLNFLAPGEAAPKETRSLTRGNVPVFGDVTRKALQDEIAAELACLPEGIWRFDAVLLATVDE